MDKQGETSSVRIRKLQGPSEAEKCASLMAQSEPWTTLRRSHDDSLKILNDPSKEIHVALKGGGLVGFVILNMSGAFVGYIQTICIAPDSRNKGIGTLMLKFAEERIFSETPNIFICVSSFNKEAQNLYERLGYEKIGELKDYIVAGHSETLLRKTSGPLTDFVKKV